MAKKHDAMDELEERILGAEEEPSAGDEYGNIHHPKKHLLTGLLYALSGAALLGGAILITRLLGG